MRIRLVIGTLAALGLIGAVPAATAAAATSCKPSPANVYCHT